MNIRILIVPAIGALLLAGCSRSDEVRAREKAREAGQEIKEAGRKIKEELKDAGQEVKDGANKAKREIKKGMPDRDRDGNADRRR